MTFVDRVLAQQLHDKVTRGATLSPKEQRELDAWYAAEDAAERDLLAASGVDPNLAELRAGIRSVMERVLVEAQHTQTLLMQNDLLQRQIDELKQQLVRRSMPLSV